MSITYRQLRDRLNQVSENHLDDDVSVLMTKMDEVFPVNDFVDTWKAYNASENVHQVDGVLDDNSPFLIVKA